MNSSAGEQTAAVYGFCALLIKVLREHVPAALAFALDSPRPTFRHAAYPEYKAGREKAPDTLTGQLGRLHQLLDGLGVPVLAAPGYEADDVLATLAHRLRAEGQPVLVVSGDRDLLQLASDGVKVLFLGARGKTPTLYDAAAVELRFGIPAERLPSWTALAGDTADNLPGVPGIGARTASRLVRQHGNVEGILADLPAIAPAKVRDALAAAAPQLRLNEDLARLRTDVPLGPGPWAAPLGAAGFAVMRDLFGALEFASLHDRLAAVEYLLRGGAMGAPPTVRGD